MFNLIPSYIFSHFCKYNLIYAQKIIIIITSNIYKLKKKQKNKITTYHPHRSLPKWWFQDPIPQD